MSDEILTGYSKIIEALTEQGRWQAARIRELEEENSQLIGRLKIGPYGAEIERLREGLQDALDVAYWMSGSPDFSPEGMAYAGWASVARPKLDKARQALERSGG